MSKNQFTGAAMQPQRNRKFCQFNKDQYCMFPAISSLHYASYETDMYAVVLV